jgi:hypothetical protein
MYKKYFKNQTKNKKQKIKNFFLFSPLIKMINFLIILSFSRKLFILIISIFV